MYVNAKMIHVRNCSRNQDRRIGERSRGREFKCDMFNIVRTFVNATIC
jgi:hypothetical protein